MKAVNTILVLITFFTFAHASTPAPAAITEYIQQFDDIAVKEMKRSGIPASVLLAQAILASEYGTAAQSIDQHNHFGTRCGLGWKGETQFLKKNKEDVTATCFRAYENPQNSFSDYTDLIMEDVSCRNLFQYSYYDYKSWAHGMQSSFHATEKNYAAKVIKLIEKYQLNKLDCPTSFSPVVQEPIIGYEFEVN